MAHSVPGGTNDFNNKIIEDFRANEGRVRCGRSWSRRLLQSVNQTTVILADRGDVDIAGS